MMNQLWVDKHRPKRLEQLQYHLDVSEVLSQLAAKDDFPHLLFYGPNGAGKKTRVYCFLQQLFGNGVYKLKSQQRVIKPQNTTTTIECWTVFSSYHVEICPADSQNNDKHVVQKFVKEAASSQNVETKNNPRPFKVLIINEADRLTKEAQAALRRTMEKYISGCRIIMICQRLNKIIAPIRSRCLNIRISAPDNESIMWALQDVVKKQNIGGISQGELNSLVELSQGNMRAAILGLQMYVNNKHQSNFKIQSLKPVWKAEIISVARDILAEQSPNKLKAIRDKLYQLLVNGVQGSLIFKGILGELQGKVKQPTMMKIIHHAATHQLTMAEGTKPVYHLQAFCAHSMMAIREQKTAL